MLAEQPRAYRESWLEGPFLKGDDIVNDKGPLGAAVFAALALDHTDIELAGDLQVTGSIGEISGTSVDEFRDRERYAGSGLGTQHLVDGGVTGDYALVAECTGISMARMECGVVWFKITLAGASTSHPLLAREEATAESEERTDVIADMARATLVLEEWGREYRREHTREFEHGTVRPTAVVGAHRAGKPYSPAATPGNGTIYLDVRLPPGEGPDTARREVETVLETIDVQATV